MKVDVLILYLGLALAGGLLAACTTSTAGTADSANSADSANPADSTDSADSTNSAIERTIFVGPNTADCVGVGPQQCLLIKENLEDEWQFWYDPIVGFDYEEGFLYELLVEEESVENPPADASSLVLVLKEIISQVPVTMEDKTKAAEIAEPLSLEGTQWEMASYSSAEGEAMNLLPGTRVTALFENGELNGSAGCNNYMGGYELDGEEISISPLASTQMFCGEPEGLMEQEFQYLAALQTAATYQIADSRLELLDASGNVAATFTAAEPVSLEDHPWEVISYNNGKEAVVSVIIGTQLTADFADGTVTGSAGCNNYNAAYELEGDSGISIGPTAATRKLCAEPEGIMEQEAQFLAALQSAVEYRIDGDRVDMFDASGARALTMAAAE